MSSEGAGTGATNEEEEKTRNKGAELKILLLEIVEASVFKSDGSVLPPKEPIWADISKKTQGKMSPRYVWQFLYQNRHGVLSALRKKFGIDDCSASKSDDDHNETVVLPKRPFSIVIPPEIWKEIKPVKGTYRRGDKERHVYKMPPFDWSLPLHDLLYDQHQISCPITFRRAIVCASPNTEKSYVSFEKGKCTECGAEVEAWIQVKPRKGQPVELKLRMPDTRGMKHTRKKHCNGSQRAKMRKIVRRMGPEEYRRKAATTKVTARSSSATHFSSYVLRKISSEGKQEELQELNIPAGDQFESLKKMKYSHPFLGSIHNIADDPVLVIYQAPIQMQVANELCKRQYSVMSIDATGSVVNRISRSAYKSSHIFLYQIVGTNGTTTMPLNQMLSERQDTNTIVYWLNDSLREGFPVPDEFVSDESPALMSALARTFGGSTSLADYQAKCFEFLRGNAQKLPKCFIRNDMAHFISNASSWKLWQPVTNPLVKEHLMRWLCLQVQSKDLEEYRNFLTHTLIIVRSETETNAVVASKTYMVKCTSTVENLPCTDFAPPDPSEEDEEDSPEDDTTAAISTFLGDIEESAANVECEECDKPNPYYLPTFAAKVMKKAKSFLLWSSVMVSHFKSPNRTGVSAYSEGVFSDVKNNVFKNQSLPIPINQFVGIHLQSIFGQGLLVSSTFSNDSSSKSVEYKDGAKDDQKQPPSFDDLNNIENWRGLGQEKRKPSKYLTPHPGIDIEVKMQALQDPKDLLLKNGNLTKFPLMNGESKIQVRNTCSFDSVIQVIAVVIIENKSFRDWVEKEKQKSEVLEVAWLLALKGTSKELYCKRAEVLVPFATLTAASQTSSNRQKKLKCAESVLQYDMWGNVINLFEKLQTHIVSAEHSWTCKANHKQQSSFVFVRVLEDLLKNQGIERVQDAIDFHLATEKKRCTNKKCKYVMTPDNTKLNNFIMIDISVAEHFTVFPQLRHVPATLQLNDFCFNLVGLVAYQPGHYVSYVKRLKGHWEYFNDIGKHPTRAKDSQRVQPVILFYCKKG